MSWADRRHKRADMEPVAPALLADLAATPGVRKAVAAGSLRRGRETVGDLDLLVTVENPTQVDLRAVALVSFGAAWLYFTGSKTHNIALRKRAQDKALKLNEYGVYRGKQRVAGDTEEAAYTALGRPFIALELREDRDRLARQMDQIDEINATLHDIVLLKGVEVDILEDGTLDPPDAVLRRLDLVVGALHGGFGLSRDKQTQRLLRTMDHPNFSVLAHPSARLINERPPCDFDLSRAIRKARERGCFLELNAHPVRLDLTGVACRMAKNDGGLVSFNPTRTLSQLRPLLDATIRR